MPTYRLHDTSGDDLGLLEHPAPNVEPGNVVVIPVGARGARHRSGRGRAGTLTALLEVAIVPTPLTSDDSIA